MKKNDEADPGSIQEIETDGDFLGEGPGTQE
jgi:hypothetical protein